MGSACRKFDFEAVAKFNGLLGDGRFTYADLAGEFDLVFTGNEIVNGLQANFFGAGALAVANPLQGSFKADNQGRDFRFRGVFEMGSSERFFEEITIIRLFIDAGVVPFGPVFFWRKNYHGGYGKKSYNKIVWIAYVVIMRFGRLFLWCASRRSRGRALHKRFQRIGDLFRGLHTHDFCWAFGFLQCVGHRFKIASSMACRAVANAFVNVKRASASFTTQYFPRRDGVSPVALPQIECSQERLVSPPTLTSLRSAPQSQMSEQKIVQSPECRFAK